MTGTCLSCKHWKPIDEAWGECEEIFLLVSSQNLDDFQTKKNFGCVSYQESEKSILERAVDLINDTSDEPEVVINKLREIIT